MKQNIFYFFVILVTFLLYFRSVSLAPAKGTSIFGNRGSRIVFEYAEFARQIPAFEFTKLETVKHNKSTPVLNVHFVIHDKGVMNYKVWVDGYEKFGMEHIYRRSAIALHCSFCDVISGSYFMNLGMSQFGNLPSKCPLKVGQPYFMRDFKIDERLPISGFPGNAWRMDIQTGPEGQKNKNGTFLMRLYLRVERYRHSPRGS